MKYHSRILEGMFGMYYVFTSDEMSSPIRWVLPKKEIQSDPNQKLQLQMSVPMKLCIFDFML